MGGVLIPGKMIVRTRMLPWILANTLAASVSLAAFAQSDNPSADLSLNPDDAVDVVYAVFGGITDSIAHYQNVTDKINSLLKKPAEFPVDEKTILDGDGKKEHQSLIVVYNYQQRVYFYNVLEGSGNLSLAKMKTQARIHPSHELEIPSPDTPDSDFRVIFATYGVGDIFWDETSRVQKLLRDDPEGFLAHEDIMGGDPHFGWNKAIIIIFDDPNGRHFFAQVNDGPEINKAVLQNSGASK